MKDSEFIELLNLYLDHEISAEDAVRLEAEVQSNPARRQIYHEYCRMQKACKMLARDFQTETSAAAEKNVAPFRPETSPRGSRSNGFYTIGAVVAAAACVAIIFVGRSRQQADATARMNAPVIAKSTPAQPAATANQIVPMAIDTPEARARAGGVMVASAVRASDGVQPTFVGAHALFLSTSGSSAVIPSNVQPNEQFAWLHTNLGLVSLEQQLQLEQLRFQTSSLTLQPSQGRALGRDAITNSKAQPPASEMATFQFTLGR